MKILKDEEYRNLSKRADKFDKFLRHHYWFSEFKFLTPMFDYFIKDDYFGGISESRDDFKRQLFKDFMSKNDHEILINQVMELCKKENKFPETDTYLTMRDKLRKKDDENQKLKAQLNAAIMALNKIQGHNVELVSKALKKIEEIGK